MSHTMRKYPASSRCSMSASSRSIWRCARCHKSFCPGRKYKARRQLQCVRNSRRQIGEQLQHLLRRLDVALAVASQQTAARIERAMVANAGEDIQNLALFRPGVLCSLRGQQRQLQAARQLDGSLIARLLCTVVVPLQFDINIFSPVDSNQLFQRGAARFHAAVCQSASQRTFVAASEAIKPSAYSLRSATEAV